MTYIAIDLGGTHTRLAAFHAPGAATFTLLEKFETQQRYTDQLTRLLGIIGQNNEIQGVSLAVGAQLSKDGHRIEVSYTMPDFVNKPIVDDLAHALGVPVKACNDNVCGALAEWRFGELGAFERAAYLTVSTGTGAGILLQEGGMGFAFLAQVGHHIINPQGALCLCGQVGCVQTITGGRQIHMKYGKKASEIADNTFWDAVTDALAVAIVNLWRITRIEALCLSGGIGLNSRYIQQNLLARIHAISPTNRVEVFAPVFGEDAPLHGAVIVLDEALPVRILH